MPYCFSENDCLWNALRGEVRPIVLYGTGNGGDKIIDVCRNYGIEISAVFASNGFVRKRTFRDMPVRSLLEVESLFPDGFVVLLAFGTTLPDVYESIREVSQRHTLYIPEVPLYGGELFDYGYFASHRAEIEGAEALFADKRSKKLYRDMIYFRMTGKPEYLLDTQEPEASYKELLADAEYIIDCGAYTGDSTKALISALSPKCITSVEPDPRTFKKLSTYAESEERCSVEVLNAAVGGENGTREFSLSGNRGSAKDANSHRARQGEVLVRTIDTIAGNRRVDLIKLDVEGCEGAALDGAATVLARDGASLALSVYHRTEDIFALSTRVHSMLPRHRLYLRRAPCIPAWDISLFAVK